jgi:hypothetical protein
MKNKTSVLVLVALFGSMVSLTAKAENTFTTIETYGIPCVLSIGLGAALMKNDGVGAGVAMCAGISAATYLTRKNFDDDKLKILVDKSVESTRTQITADVDLRIQKSSDDQTAKMEEFKTLMREVLADRLVKMQEDEKTAIETQIRSGDFMPTLEKHLNEKIKDSVVTESKAHQKELVSEVVDEVIHQVEAKPIGLSK